MPCDIQSDGKSGIVGHRVGLSIASAGISHISIAVDQSFFQKIRYMLCDCRKGKSKL